MASSPRSTTSRASRVTGRPYSIRDDRQADAGRLQAMAHLDTGFIAEIDIENDADGSVEVAVLLERIG